MVCGWFWDNVHTLCGPEVFAEGCDPAALVVDSAPPSLGHVAVTSSGVAV